MGQKELDETAKLRTEIESWRTEYESKKTSAERDRGEAKSKHDADRLTLEDKEKARLVEQERLIEETKTSMNSIAALAPPQPSLVTQVLVKTTWRHAPFNADRMRPSKLWLRFS